MSTRTRTCRVGLDGRSVKDDAHMVSLAGRRDIYSRNLPLEEVTRREDLHVEVLARLGGISSWQRHERERKVERGMM